LGLAAVAALALAASVGAATASASYFTADSYPAVAYTPEDISQEIAFGWSMGGSCEGFPLATVMTDAEEQIDATLGGSVDCTAMSWFEGPATFKSNDCRFTYHAGAETAPGKFSGTMDIGPPGCGPMRLDGDYCKRAIGAQSGVPLTIENKGSGTGATTYLEAKGELDFTLVGGAPATCGLGQNPAWYVGRWEIATMNEEGEAVGNSVSAVGVYLGGEGPKVEAESYPTNLVGKQDPGNAHLVKFQNNRRLWCSNITLDSTLSGASSELTQSPEYAGCTAEILGNLMPTTVQANSCSFGTTVSAGGPPYAGTLSVSCSKEGDALEIKVFQNAEKQAKGETFCHYKIAPQSGLKGLGLSNIGSGTERKVAVEFESVSIAYTRVSGTLTNCGAASSTATYTGTTNIEGF
jgi:hypothetical protein